METTDPRSLAIAKIHLQNALRKDGERMTMHWGSFEAHQAMLTDALQFLGFDVNAGSEDFEEPPAQMPEVAELLVLTKTGIQKLNSVISQPSSASPSAL